MAEPEADVPSNGVSGVSTRGTARHGNVAAEAIHATKWAVQRARYMTLETIAPMADDPIISLPAAAN